ncbi:oligosaccharide flippase family protein [Bradyrhizobium sp. JYMT SZCCT0428]|uniref:oligosaccharide flippase family protein n=1 Tax=Bradyrhizobium sp. JYMT SZCCT0428 TaxID=2807673 RepID=UPI0024C0506E|nr:oligosaccharide flippase family protein [Bradyrhizobium sp. JYMT SZCCT0428]MBR1151590.1 oligosaccharide flippase family protein [Bradyrhizobium sp. JYMT SZCCT0428]
MLWSVLEHGSTTLISFLSLIVFAKFLEPRDFGAYAIAFSVIEIIGILPSNFFYEALVRLDKARDEHFNAAFTISMLLGILAFGFLWLILPFLASLVNEPRISELGKVLGVALLITGPISIFTARQSREFGFRVLAQRTLIGRLAGAALGILAAFYHLGVWALVIQYLSMVVLGSTALVLFSSWWPRLTTKWRAAADLLHYGFGSVVALSATFITKRAFGFYVGVFLGIEQAGFLNLAFRIFDTVWAISAAAISEVMLPFMARLQGDREKLLRAYCLTLVAGCLLLYPAFAGLGIVAPEVIQLMFGDKWIHAAQPSLWLGLLIFVQAPRIFQSSLLKISGNIDTVRSVNLTALTVMIVGIAATKLPSVTLALVLWAVTETVNFVLLSFFVQRKLHYPILKQLRLILVPLLASCAMVGAVALGRAYLPPSHALLQLFYLCGIGAVTYIGLILLFGRRSLVNVVHGLRTPKAP